MRLIRRWGWHVVALLAILTIGIMIGWWTLQPEPIKAHPPEIFPAVWEKIA